MIPSYYDAPNVSEGSDDMRGPDEQTSHMFSYLSAEQRVRADHPLRAIRVMTDRVFADLSRALRRCIRILVGRRFPRAVAARVGVAVALHRTERALADGRDRLQRVVA